MGVVMAIFLISPLDKNSRKLDEKIEDVFAESDRYKLHNSRDWLISSKDTSKVLAEKLDIKKTESKEERNAALVVHVSSFWGLGNREMWEWLDMHIEK